MIFKNKNIKLICFIFACFSQNITLASTHEAALSFFSPLPKVMPDSEKDTQAQISLGKKLYFETALSLNYTQSCNSCHNIINDGAGVDNLTVSVGALNKKGSRNAPSTWNAGLHIAQFWDGRAKTLEQQASFPLFNPKEMAMPSKEEVIKRLKNKGYSPYFTKAFPEYVLSKVSPSKIKASKIKASQIEPAQVTLINIKNLSKALAAFQRTLITRDRFDEYLAGNKKAISIEEERGLSIFIDKGCVACHNGAVLGGQLFMKMGIVHPYPNKIDKGKAQATGKAADSYIFKVPSLRNILNTAPYFHDGAATTIEQAIEDTGWHQLGIRLNPEDVTAIKSFFNTLNNKVSITNEKFKQ